MIVNTKEATELVMRAADKGITPEVYKHLYTKLMEKKGAVI